MGKHDVWIRHVMDSETRRLVSEIEPRRLSVCEVSGEAWGDMFTWSRYTSLSYPQFDVCKDNFPDHYDLIISEQVFEHIRYPWAAAKNIYEHLKDGGYFLITVPFIFHIHPTPLDGWRWTPQGLAFMLEDAGFDAGLIQTGAWGNYECFLRHAIEQTAPAMNPQFSLANVPHIPQMVWARAQKRR